MLRYQYIDVKKTDMPDGVLVAPLFNAPSTRVEVCHAMVHGGPFLATTAVRTTAVGSEGVCRFVCQVCYQNYPASLLPYHPENTNWAGIMRELNGVYTRNCV